MELSATLVLGGIVLVAFTKRESFGLLAVDTVSLSRKQPLLKETSWGINLVFLSHPETPDAKELLV